MEFCIYCGTKIKVTNWDRKFCPNCGILDEEKDSENEKPDYIQ